MARSHPRAAAVEGRAAGPGLVLADGPALELRVRQRGGARRVEHAGHRPAVVIHVLHGFLWHYGSLVRPDLDKYPEDIFRALCAPWLDP